MIKNNIVFSNKKEARKYIRQRLIHYKSLILNILKTIQYGQSLELDMKFKIKYDKKLKQLSVQGEPTLIGTPPETDLPEIKIDPAKMDSIEIGAGIGKARTIKPKKVYCKNCEYYDIWERKCYVGNRRGSSYFNETYINHKGYKSTKWKNEKEFDELCNITKSRASSYDYTIKCCNFNLDNDCKFYRRKWWKFWV